MTDKFEDRAAVAGKIEHEGTIWDALQWGIRASDMPEGDHELQVRWARLETAFQAASDAWDAVEKLLDDQ